jgi:IclR family transcriptional regulator, acetate operon repressor
LSVTSEHELPGTRIRSVARASRLLLLLARRPGGCTAAEAARELELTVPTTHHLLNTLVEEGLAVKDSQRRFALGPQVAVLADGLVRQTVPEYLGRPLRELAVRTEETAYLAAWGGGEIRVLASVEGAGAVRVAEVERGPYRHAHARATGKLLLAYAQPEVRAAYLAAHPPERLTDRTITAPAALERELDAIRERGYSEDREEFVEGVSCVSAPLLAEGVVVAAFTVSAPSQRYDRRRTELRDAVLAAAAAALSPPASQGVRRSA